MCFQVSLEDGWQEPRPEWRRGEESFLLQDSVPPLPYDRPQVEPIFLVADEEAELWRCQKTLPRSHSQSRQGYPRTSVSHLEAQPGAACLWTDLKPGGERGRVPCFSSLDVTSIPTGGNFCSDS